MENNTFSPTNYLIRTSRQLNCEQGDEKFIITLVASKLTERKMLEGNSSFWFVY
jgi:hypothetical protein